MNVTKIYTDGACKGNPGPGGWGAVIERPGLPAETAFGGESLTTNNRMELMAAIQGLSRVTGDALVAIYTDSVYVKQGINAWIDKWKKNGWLTAQKTPVKNKDLWQQLDELNQRCSIEWHWVKGHSGHPGNELADQLANQGVGQ